MLFYLRLTRFATLVANIVFASAVASPLSFSAVLALNPKNCCALLAIFWTVRSASNRLVRPNLNIKKGRAWWHDLIFETDTIRTCDLHLRRVAL